MRKGIGAAIIAIVGLGAPASATAILEQVSPTPTLYVFTDDFNLAGFGATSFDITASLYRLSGTATAGLSLGCSAGDFGSGVAGTIVLLARGTCNFTVKAKNAQDAGALAILVANSFAGVDLAPTLGGSDPDVTIAAFGLSTDLGALLANQTLTEPTIMRLARNDATGPIPDVPEPATWLTMLAGFGLIGTGLRARRKATAWA